MIEAISVVLFVAALTAVYFRGRQDGRQREKNRCAGLVHQAICTRMSGTTRWALNAIADDRTELLPYEEFFGESLHATRASEIEEERARRVLLAHLTHATELTAMLPSAQDLLEPIKWTEIQKQHAQLRHLIAEFELATRRK